MDRYERAALLDFIAAIVWPSRTVATVSAGGGQSTFDVLGSWDTAHDVAMAWINGNRVSGTITWVNASRITLPTTAPQGSQVVIFVTPGAGTGYLPRSGLAPMLGPFDLGGFRAMKAGASVAPDDLVRRDEVAVIAQTLVGGNYVLKTGDEMEGVLKLADAALLTDPAAAVRRDMVILPDASRDFTGKPKCPATQDGDPATTMTTKAWVEAKIAEAIAGVLQPNQQVVFSTYGAGFTWTVPAGVTKIWVQARGSKGGKGGIHIFNDNVFRANGGGPGTATASITVTPGAVASITVSRKGFNGMPLINPETSGDPGNISAADGTGRSAAGGGGGGASQFMIGEDVLTAGGGGGGGGCERDGGGTAGATGGKAAGTSRGNQGGAPGNTIEEGGGAGGARASNAYSESGLSGSATYFGDGSLDTITWTNGVTTSDGMAGTGDYTDRWNTTDVFPFQGYDGPVQDDGYVTIKWYEDI